MQMRRRPGPRRAHPRVALLVETSNAYGRGLLHGIAAYIREHGPWSVYVSEHGRGTSAPSWLKRWGGDGIVARIESRATARTVLASGLPVVNVSLPRFAPKIPYLETDDDAIGTLGARHLIDRQFQHFAYCGFRDFEWSDLRKRAFVRTVREAGHDAAVLEVPRTRMEDPTWERWHKLTVRWLLGLPKPVAIMACYDVRARQVLEACGQAGIPVPDEVAVVGVDNDETLCDIAYPGLTSVIPDTHRTGYLAATFLDRLLRGERGVPASTLLPPLGLATRRSTDMFASSDPMVAAAARFVRERACEGIGVDDLVAHVGASRRVLEQRFARELGRSPHAQIMRVRIERVQELLRTTTLSLGEIAARTGFRYAEYMSAAFKKKVGQSPQQFRGR